MQMILFDSQPLMFGAPKSRYIFWEATGGQSAVLNVEHDRRVLLSISVHVTQHPLKFVHPC